MRSTLRTGGFSVVTLEGNDSSAWAWTGADGLVLKGVTTGSEEHPRIRVAITTLLNELDGYYRKPVSAALTADAQVAKIARKSQLVAAGRLTIEDEARTESRDLYRSARAVATWESWERLVRDDDRSDQLVGTPGAHILIAADGSHEEVTNVGTWCWYAENGVGGMGVTTGHTSGYAELRSIYEALSHVAPGAHVTILSDCMGVIRTLGFTAKGARAGVSRQGKRGGRVSAEEHSLRVVTRDLVRSTGAQVKWVKGHSGHELHTVADHRARAALRSYLRYQNFVASTVAKPQTFLERVLSGWRSLNAQWSLGKSPSLSASISAAQS